MADDDIPLPVITIDTIYSLTTHWIRNQEVSLANRVFRGQHIFSEARFTYDEGTPKLTWDAEIRIYFWDEANDGYIYNVVAANPSTGITTADYSVIYTRRDQTSGNTVVLSSTPAASFDRAGTLGNTSGDVVIIGMTNTTNFNPAFSSGELANLAKAEIQQLENINAVTISNTQWGYLGALTESPQTHMSHANPHSGVVSHVAAGNPHSGSAPTIHNLIDTTNHPVSGLASGDVLKALSATTYGFAAPSAIPRGLGKNELIFEELFESYTSGDNISNIADRHPTAGFDFGSSVYVRASNAYADTGSLSAHCYLGTSLSISPRFGISCFIYTGDMIEITWWSRDQTSNGANGYGMGDFWFLYNDGSYALTDETISAIRFSVLSFDRTTSSPYKLLRYFNGSSWVSMSLSVDYATNYRYHLYIKNSMEGGSYAPRFKFVVDGVGSYGWQVFPSQFDASDEVVALTGVNWGVSWQTANRYLDTIRIYQRAYGYSV